MTAELARLRRNGISEPHDNDAAATRSNDAAEAPNRPEASTPAQDYGPLITRLLGGTVPLRIIFWDDSAIGPGGSDHIRLRGPEALRHLLWSPNELGWGRAYVTGGIEHHGDVIEMLHTFRYTLAGATRRAATVVPELIATMRRRGEFGPRPPLPEEELVPDGIRHSLKRDRQVISHHYDVGNAFYELILGPAMTYSCARFPTPDTTLEDAQASKHELICRKLGLDQLPPGGRLLDIGCGWGSMAIHAAAHHDVQVVGITLSQEQASYARQRVSDRGLDDRIEIRIQDYREINDGPFDAISSIGMAEHVGSKRMLEYFNRLYSQLLPGGRLLNHAIASTGGSKLSRRSFTYRYVFPDGELLDIADTLREMQRAGFDVRDVENLREHYATTLRHWVDRLETDWDRAVRLVGERRARIWLLYMAGSISGFTDGGHQLMQTLAVKTHAGGRSDMPPTRAHWS